MKRGIKPGLLLEGISACLTSCVGIEGRADEGGNSGDGETSSQDGDLRSISPAVILSSEGLSKLRQELTLLSSSSVGGLSVVVVRIHYVSVGKLGQKTKRVESTIGRYGLGVSRPDVDIGMLCFSVGILQ